MWDAWKSSSITVCVQPSPNSLFALFLASYIGISHRNHVLLLMCIITCNSILLPPYIPSLPRATSPPMASLKEGNVRMEACALWALCFLRDVHVENNHGAQFILTIPTEYLCGWLQAEVILTISPPSWCLCSVSKLCAVVAKEVAETFKLFVGFHHLNRDTHWLSEVSEDLSLELEDSSFCEKRQKRESRSGYDQLWAEKTLASLSF